LFDLDPSGEGLTNLGDAGIFGTKTYRLIEVDAENSVTGETFRAWMDGEVLRLYEFSESTIYLIGVYKGDGTDAEDLTEQGLQTQTSGTASVVNAGGNLDLEVAYDIEGSSISVYCGGLCPYFLIELQPDLSTNGSVTLEQSAFSSGTRLVQAGPESNLTFLDENGDPVMMPFGNNEPLSSVSPTVLEGTVFSPTFATLTRTGWSAGATLMYPAQGDGLGISIALNTEDTEEVSTMRITKIYCFGLPGI
jgi:hypothetical protein